MKKYKKFIVIIPVLVLLIVFSIQAAFKINATESDRQEPADILTVTQTDTAKSVTTGNLQTVNKDETVYVNLNYDGTISKINVVNYFKVLEPGIYVDYGNYNRVINLTDDNEPVIQEDSIQWVFDEPAGDFYYQGQMETGRLPWLFQIEYYVNGILRKAEELAGASGELTLRIDVTENEESYDYFKDNFMLQLMIPLSMDKCNLLSAPGAVQMITGRTKMLAYTLLPRTSQLIEIQASVKDFIMEPIDITMMKAELSDYMQTDSMKEGFIKMSDGMEELTSGTKQLSDGMVSLSQGMDRLSEGLNSITKHTPELRSGMQELNSGLTIFRNSLSELSHGSLQLKEGLKELQSNSTNILSGYQKIQEGLTTMTAMKQEIAPVASEMTLSLDPAEAGLATALLGFLEGLTELEQGMKSLNAGLQEYMQGVGEISGQYNSFHFGIEALPEGFQGIHNGYSDVMNANNRIFTAVGDLNKGLAEVSKQTQAIPSKTHQLYEGQIALKNGMNDAVEEIDKLINPSSKEGDLLLSFAAPERITPSSVQFVIRTPAIEKERIKAERAEEEKVGFWERLKRLFTD